MSAIERAKQTYAVVPRTLDERLERRARGDRGCLYDLISLLGILSMFAFLIASQMGLMAFSWTYLGAAIWVGSYFMGLSRQSKSGKVRRAALESGPLVVGAVVRCSPHLRDSGNKRAGRAALVFSLDDATRFDGAALRTLADTLVDWPAPAGSVDPSDAKARAQRLLHDEFCFDMVDISGLALEGGRTVGAQTWLARVVVDPEGLDAPLSGSAAQVAVIVDPARSFAEHV